MSPPAAPRALSEAAASAARRLSFLHPGCAFKDLHGCCVSSRMFWCGSSNRCVHDWDVCEDLSADIADCRFAWAPAIGGDALVTFDLSALHDKGLTSGADFAALDPALNTSQFVFNVCANIATPPLCVNTTGAAPGEHLASPMPAGLLVDADGDGAHDTCYRLGASVYSGAAAATAAPTPAPASAVSPGFSLGLVDNTQPARGVYVRYQGGNSCSGAASAADGTAAESGWCQARDGYCTYSLSLNFLCDNLVSELAPAPDATRLLSPCHYELSFRHQLGCPTECGRDKHGRVCSGRGACTFDGTPGDGGANGAARCVCEAPYGGTACEHVSNGASGPHLSVGFFVAFAIFGVAIGVCIVGARKWMRARLEMHRELQRRGGYSHVSQDDEAPSPGARHAGQVELGPRG